MSAATRTRGVFSRRGLLAVGGSAAAAGAVVATGLVRGLDTDPEQTAPPAEEPDAPVAFHGLHQAGIANPAPGHLLLTAYDTSAKLSRTELAEVFKAWTAAARDLTTGRSTTDDPLIGADAGPSALTITVGLGRALLARLRIEAPAALADLPAFAGDELETRRSDGDIVVQICAEDPHRSKQRSQPDGPDRRHQQRLDQSAGSLRPGLGRHRRAGVDDGRLLSRRTPDPDAARLVGGSAARRARRGHRAP